MIKDYTFYDYLNDHNKKLVDQINNHEILGASKHLDLLSDMFINIVENNKERSVEELVNQIENMKKFYFDTRGTSSRAIVNGINKLLLKVNNTIVDTQTLLRVLRENQLNFIEENKSNLDKILEYSGNELKNHKNILLFDYSSTVEKAVKTVLENNPSFEYNIYVSESSAIDGGSPYLTLNDYENTQLYFFPDATLAHYISLSDCCLMGAETFYADGTGFNTIGSDIVSLLCESYQVPLYFITPMNKLDNRRTKGIKKETVTTDYRNKYKYSDRLEENIITIIPELVGVVPSTIYAFITENGVIPSNQMFSYSLKYIDNMEGDVK